MNIFYLHPNPRIAASAMTDKHVVKMILESAQLMSTAHHELDGDKAPKELYKSTHKNHPSAVWVRQSLQNYKWLYTHFIYLHEEYEKRYKRTHKTYYDLVYFLINPPKNIPVDQPFTEPPCAMPDEYKTGNTVESYRIYYQCEKLHNLKDGRRFMEMVNEDKRTILG